MGIAEKQKETYLKTALFEQLLIQLTAAASDGVADVFSIDDAVQGIKYYSILECHYRFWAKSLKRILVDMKFPHSLITALTDSLIRIF